MSHSRREDFLNLEELIIRGKYKEALEEIDNLEESFVDDSIAMLNLQILKTQAIHELGEYQQALVLSTNTFQEAEKLNNKNLMLKSRINLTNALRYLGQFKEALKEANVAEELIKELEIDFPQDLSKLKAIVFFNKGTCSRATGDQKSTIIYINKSIELLEKQAESLELCDALDAKSMYIKLDSDKDEAKRLLERSLKIREKIGNRHKLAVSYNRLGSFYSTISDLDNAMESYEKTLAISEEYDIKDMISVAKLNIGNILRKKGELNQSLKSYLESLRYSKIVGNKHMIAAAFFNISGIYLERGEINKALEHQKNTLKEFEELNFKQGIASVLSSIGSSYYTKGNLELASTFYTQSLSIRKELNDTFSMADLLYNLVSVYLDEGLLEQAKDYQNQLEEIKGRFDYKILTHMFNVSEARLLKTNPRLKNRVKAEELLKSVISDEIVSSHITIDAYLLLADLLLDELRFIGDKNILSELNELIEKLVEVSKDQQISSLLAKTYLLKSQLALINLDIAEAKYMLSQAQFIAEEKELHGLAFKISEEYDKLQSRSDEWDVLIERNAPIDERLSLITMSEVISSMVGKSKVELPENIEEEPVFLVIQNKTGKTLFTEKFQPLSKLDGSLIGGFIAAINSFAQELFNAPGHIERIKHQDYTLVLKTEGELLFTYVYKGQSYTSIRRLSDYVNTLKEHSEIWNQLLETSKTPKPLSPEVADSVKNLSITGFS